MPNTKVNTKQNSLENVGKDVGGDEKACADMRIKTVIENKRNQGIDSSNQETSSQRGNCKCIQQESQITAVVDIWENM